MNCANIFDSETNSSFVYRDLEVKLGTSDYSFNYNYTDCPDYKFDQNLMTF